MSSSRAMGGGICWRQRRASRCGVRRSRRLRAQWWSWTISRTRKAACRSSGSSWAWPLLPLLRLWRLHPAWCGCRRRSFRPRSSSIPPSRLMLWLLLTRSCPSPACSLWRLDCPKASACRRVSIVGAGAGRCAKAHMSAVRLQVAKSLRAKFATSSSAHVM